MFAAWYHRVDVKRPFIIRALPLRLKSRCFHVAIIVLSLCNLCSMFQSVHSVLPT